MQDNAPSHASRATGDFLARKGFRENKIMTWPPSSPDLNPIENLWAIVKKELYKGGKQYKSKSELWDAIETVVKAISPDTIKTLTSSMDERLMRIIEKKGGYINM